jgi:hypothetical protein
VVLDTELKERKSWVVWAEDGKYPKVIIEILSKTAFFDVVGTTGWAEKIGLYDVGLTFKFRSIKHDSMLAIAFSLGFTKEYYLLITSKDNVSSFPKPPSSPS